jgi:hypothetical protein
MSAGDTPKARARYSTRISSVRWLGFTMAAMFALLPARYFHAQEKNVEANIDPGLTAHEWGTFTSIAGNDGLAVRWLPLSGPNDLPSFVEHLRNASFKFGVAGTVRMETPVIYFYSTHRTNVSVHVAFSKGLITEWYPHADSVRPSKPLTDTSLYQRDPDGTISWDSITVDPDGAANYPGEGRASHYYAARETNASPLLVPAKGGAQREKFLFYRGVSTFSVPMSVRVLQDGRLLVGNSSGEANPQAILFERRGERMGYRVVGTVPNAAIVASPELDSDIDTLSGELENVLTAQGLFPEEAHAMVQTWRDSWFEEGSRLLYIVPRALVDSVLPLSIQPEPANTVRVFVGRLEVVTPATEKDIQTALASHDRAALAKYGRFLEPILQTMLERSAGNTPRTRRLRTALDSVYGELYAQNQTQH